MEGREFESERIRVSRTLIQRGVLCFERRERTVKGEIVKRRAGLCI